MTCACGQPIAPTSERCKPCDTARRRAAAMRVCRGCGTSFRRKTSGRNKGLYCSRACAFSDPNWRGIEERAAARARAREQCRVVATCRVCGKAASPRNTFCGPACRGEFKRREARRYYSEVIRANRVKPKPCLYCGVEFVANRQGARVCSETCSLALRRNNARAAKARRRARQRGVHSEAVSPLRVFRRDGWRCYLCGCETPQAARGSMASNAPELDHVVPLAVGGAHSYVNVRCACRLCNQSKGAMSVDAFLSERDSGCGTPSRT